MDIVQTTTHTDRRSYWMVWIATVTFFGGFYALLAPLPRYLVAIGLADWQVGVILGAFGVASLLGRPVAGRATDRWGARPVMLAGAVALLLGALGVLATTNALLLFALRLLQAAGYVAFTTAGTGLVVALAVPEERGRRLAVFGAAANVAITLAPAATTALLAVATLNAGFLVAAALAGVAGLLAWCVPADLSNRSETSDPFWSFPRRVWTPMVIAALLGMGFASFFQFAPLLAERRTVIDAGWLYTLYGLGLILTRFGGGGLVDRWDTAPMLALTALLMATGLAIFAIATTPASLLLATLLLAGSGLFHPTLIAYIASLLPNTPGRASAAFYVGFDLGIGLGSWILGILLQLAGLPGLYFTAAAAAILVLPLLPALADPGRRP